jgi:hypothetical protein
MHVSRGQNSRLARKKLPPSNKRGKLHVPSSTHREKGKQKLTQQSHSIVIVIAHAPFHACNTLAPRRSKTQTKTQAREQHSRVKPTRKQPQRMIASVHSPQQSHSARLNVDAARIIFIIIFDASLRARATTQHPPLKHR